MGTYLSSPEKPSRKSVKRKRSEQDSSSSEEDEETGSKDAGEEETYLNIDLHTPKRKKLKTTSKYIYETLFVNGENSDITVIAFNHEWKLHKVYLCQSGYFACMFSGSWKESNQTVIDMSEIPDPNIDENALHVAFGSLYRDDVLIRPSRVHRILAAATLLQLDGLIQQCADTMRETISAKTVCSYYDASLVYGCQNITKKCIDWLEMNLMTTQSASLLREISPELMTDLISSPDLFVMHVEMDIYTMLKKWSFLQLVSDWPGVSKHLGSAADDFFKDKHNKELLRNSSKNLLAAFRGIRYQHVINDMMSANLLEEENLIPKQWLLPLYRRQWKHMLSVEQGIDKGPTEEVTEHQFYKLALRCGRVLSKEGEYCWRWTGYNYGIDLLVTYSNRLIVFKRNTYSQMCPNSVSLNQKRDLMFRVTVASLNAVGQTTFIKSSSITRLSLNKDEESVIMSVDRSVSLPLHISVNILYYSPNKEDELISDELDTETLNPIVIRKKHSSCDKIQKKSSKKSPSNRGGSSSRSQSDDNRTEFRSTSSRSDESQVTDSDLVTLLIDRSAEDPQPGPSEPAGTNNSSDPDAVDLSLSQ
ncbi:germ cell-less protein-like 1 [Tubulanus polymorphus]|uniref:germ cell-less protein-like 1 n=1 Tax=Tubulanus polymorphus TaxID=672921 RepID=UPI003DA2D609